MRNIPRNIIIMNWIFMLLRIQPNISSTTIIVKLVYHLLRSPHPKVASNDYCLLLFTLWSMPQTYIKLGWPVWPLEYCNRDGVWLLKLNRNRHCGFYLALSGITCSGESRRNIQQPNEENHVVWRTEASCQQQLRHQCAGHESKWAIVNAYPPTPIKSSHDCSPDLYLDCHLMRDSEPASYS